MTCLQVFGDKQQIYKFDHFIVLDVREHQRHKCFSQMTWQSIQCPQIYFTLNHKCKPHSRAKAKSSSSSKSVAPILLEPWISWQTIQYLFFHCSFSKQMNSHFFPSCPRRPCTHSFRLSWTPTHSPARRRRRRKMELGARREKRKRKGRERWMTCPPYHPKLPGWWRCTAAPWCCRGRHVCPRHSPPKPSATSSSSPTPHCSILC